MNLLSSQSKSVEEPPGSTNIRRPALEFFGLVIVVFVLKELGRERGLAQSGPPPLTTCCIFRVLVREGVGGAERGEDEYTVVDWSCDCCCSRVLVDTDVTHGGGPGRRI